MDNLVWELFLNRELLFWNDAKRSAGRVRDYILDFSRFVQTPDNTLASPGPPIINLTNMRRYEAVAVIEYVLSQKLKLRGRNARYNLTWTRNGSNADPYVVFFVWRNVKHRMMSNYNGNSPQVGNHVTESFVNGVWKRVLFDYVDINDPALDFLLMSEIARRKCCDPNHPINNPLGLDQFHQLPIAFSIAVAIRLIKENKISFTSVFQNNQQNDVFRGNQRMNNSKHLLQTALEHYQFGELCNIVHEYYGFSSSLNLIVVREFNSE